MTHTKKSTVKNIGDAEVVAPIKLKKEFDIDGQEIFPADKVEESEVNEEAEDKEEGDDGPELDDEEINPFKDKWEE